jgi:hypothetical protein
MPERREKPRGRVHGELDGRRVAAPGRRRPRPRPRRETAPSRHCFDTSWTCACAAAPGTADNTLVPGTPSPRRTRRATPTLATRDGPARAHLLARLGMQQSGDAPVSPCDQ